jgi:hypothetical protein
MKRVKYIFLFTLFFGVVFVSCKKDVDTGETTNLGYNYFPDDIGRYVIYEVDSTWQDDESNIDTAFRYLLKEVIESVFIDNSGRPTLRIERYKKMYNPSIPYDSMTWMGPKVWYANITSSTAEKVEENIRYIKLIFPSKEGKEWDGNTFNSLGQKYYEIISIDEPETINSVYCDSVVTVKQFEQIDFIEHIYEVEKYARNVGLIYKVRDSLSWASDPKDTVGYTFKQKIVSYGQ